MSNMGETYSIELCSAWLSPLDLNEGLNESPMMKGTLFLERISDVNEKPFSTQLDKYIFIIGLAQMHVIERF